MEYFKLYGNCFIVKGASQAQIYDLHTNKSFEISLNLANLYEDELEVLPLNQVYKKYSTWALNIKEFINYLMENDLGFKTTEPDNFPDMSKSFRIYNKIYSAVIELDMPLLQEEKTLAKYLNLLDDLRASGCFHFCLVIRDKIKDKSGLQKLLASFKESRVRTVKVILDKPYLDFDELDSITNDMRVSYKIYSAPTDDKVKGRWWYKESKFGFELIEYTTNKFDLNKKTNYSKVNLIVSSATFTESQKHNPFFNKKVCISKGGDYKNDLSFSDSYGNFRSKPLTELLADDAFTELWLMSNDKIETCKICQFRYACTGNSNVINKNGQYHKVDACQFDPVSNVWN